MDRSRIILVEDNDDNQFLVEAILDDFPQYELACFLHPHEALKALEAADTAPRLFLFDISLPDMDGMGLLDAVRNRPHLAGVPAIALTAHAMQGDREKFLAHGFSDYVSKPIIDKRVLLDAIDRHILKI